MKKVSTFHGEDSLFQSLSAKALEFPTAVALIAANLVPLECCFLIGACFRSCSFSGWRALSLVALIA